MRSCSVACECGSLCNGLTSEVLRGRAEGTYRAQFYQAIERALTSAHHIGEAPGPKSLAARRRWLNKKVPDTGFTRVEVLRAGMSDESLRLPTAFTKEGCDEFARRARVHHAEWRAAASDCKGDLLCRDIDSFRPASATPDNFYGVA